MALGQGANSALPIVAHFLKRVYADSRLGYSPDETFDLPAGFDPCSSDVSEDAEDVSENIGLDSMAN